jgi:hypothetical protein
MHRPAPRRIAAVSPAISLSAAFALAALVASPAPARACEPSPRVTVGVAVPFPPAPPPWVAAALPPPVAVPGAPIALSVYLAWLDANRAAYLARWGWNPWRVARYDAWYREWRAGLDERWTPRRVAWAPARGHGYGHGKHEGRGHHDD